MLLGYFLKIISLLYIHYLFHHISAILKYMLPIFYSRTGRYFWNAPISPFSFRYLIFTISLWNVILWRNHEYDGGEEGWITYHILQKGDMLTFAVTLCMPHTVDQSTTSMIHVKMFHTRQQSKDRLQNRKIKSTSELLRIENCKLIIEAKKW